MESFPAGVGEKLQFYVYRLIDPRNGETFYVGKGKGNRVFQHVAATKATDILATEDNLIDSETFQDDDESLKVKPLTIFGELVLRSFISFIVMALRMQEQHTRSRQL